MSDYLAVMIVVAGLILAVVAGVLIGTHNGYDTGYDDATKHFHCKDKGGKLTTIDGTEKCVIKIQEAK